jgi:phospholipid transport system substrate-binding protein
MNLLLLKFRFLGMLFFALAGSVPPLVAAAADDPSGFLRNAVDQVLDVAYSGQSNASLPERVRPLLERDFSFELVTRQAIGPGWKQFSPDQQRRVIDLFSRLMLRIYSARVVGSQRPSVTYGQAISLGPDRFEIPTKTSFPNRDKPVSVVYRLLKTSGGWRIYDLLLEGVSFVANYRAQFDPIVQRGGATAVIETLQTKLSEPVAR